MLNRRHSTSGRLLLFIALLVGLIACNDDDNPADPGSGSGPFDLTFTGTVAPHVGQTFHAVVIRTDDGSVAASGETVVPASGNFSFTWTDVLAKDGNDRIDYYADVSGNGAGDTPPTDHAWRLTFGPVTADVTRDFQHDANFTDVCGSFAP